MFTKKSPAPASKRRTDPTNTKAYRSGVSSAVSKVRAKLNGEWGEKMKKARQKIAASKKDIVDVAVHDIAIPSVAGTATSLALDVLVSKSATLKKNVMLSRAVKVLGGVALTTGASFVKPARRYAPAFTNGPLTVVLSDMGREMLKKQLSGIDEDAAAAQAYDFQAQRDMAAIQQLNDMAGIPFDAQPSAVGRVYAGNAVVN